MTKCSLSLDDVLEDSPQTRCLLKLFEEDATKVHDYMVMVQGALQRLVTAQTEVTIAMQQLGDIFNTYGTQSFPLERNETEFPAVIDKFQRTVTELASWMEIVSQQLQNCVLYPVDKFIHDTNELHARKEVFHSIADDLDTAVLKHAKVGRKDASKKLDEANEELCAVRRRFHLAGLRYYVQLNNLQFSRRIALLEPVLSMLYAFRSFFHVGHQALTNDKELSEFLGRTQEQLQSLHSEKEADTKTYDEFLKTVSEIERLQPDIYNVEATSPANVDNSTLSHKQGYLYLKSKSALMTKWERYYFFTQIGSLMYQGRDELAGQLLVELNGAIHAAVADHEDRRHTFEIKNNSNSKIRFVFQACSERERDEWIATINNLSAENDGGDAATTLPKENVGSTSNREPESELNKPNVVGVSAGDATTVFTAPIQFDMSTLSVEDEQQQAVSFDENASGHDPPILSEIVKFLGSMEVTTDRDERTAHDAARQVLAARDIHKITKTFSTKLIVTNGVLHLLDPDSRVVKTVFNLDDLALWTADNNKPIVALIVRTKGGKADGRHKFTCYVFECDEQKTAENICSKLLEATKLAFRALAEKKHSSGDQPDSAAVAGVTEKVVQEE